jgi:hypothetical protein
MGRSDRGLWCNKIRGACGANRNSPTARAKRTALATRLPRSGRAKGKRALAARLPRSGSTKKGAWGRGTARTQTAVGVDVVRDEAVPGGRAAVMRGVEPGTAAQQLPATLSALTAHQITILLSPGFAIG